MIGTRFADSFHGDTKSNAFYGGDDMDSLWGLGGNDSLYAEAGNDTVYGDAGNDVMNGGSGDDSVSYYQSPGPVIVNVSTGKASGRGSDTVSQFEWLDGTDFDDLLIGDDGPNRFQDEMATISCGTWWG